MLPGYCLQIMYREDTPNVLVLFNDLTDLCGPGILQLPIDQNLTMTSPLFPEFYPDGLDCVWIVTTENNRGLSLEFDFFSVQKGFDFLILGSGNQTTDSTRISRFSGTKLNIPDTVIIPNDSIWLRFKTGRSWNDAGYILRVSSIPNKCDFFFDSLYICIKG